MVIQGRLLISDNTTPEFLARPPPNSQSHLDLQSNQFINGEQSHMNICTHNNFDFPKINHNLSKWSLIMQLKVVLTTVNPHSTIIIMREDKILITQASCNDGCLDFPCILPISQTRYQDVLCDSLIQGYISHFVFQHPYSNMYSPTRIC